MSCLNCGKRLDGNCSISLIYAEYDISKYCSVECEINYGAVTIETASLHSLILHHENFQWN